VPAAYVVDEAEAGVVRRVYEMYTVEGLRSGRSRVASTPKAYRSPKTESRTGTHHRQVPGERSGESLSVREGTRRGLVPTRSRQPPPLLPARRSQILQRLSSIRANKNTLFWAAIVFPAFLTTAAILGPKIPRLWNGSGLIPIPSAKQVAVLGRGEDAECDARQCSLFR